MLTLFLDLDKPKMTEKTATEASNDFWLQFKAERQNIDNLLQQSQSIPTTELTAHFDTILQKINILEKKLTEATQFIPSYDERQFSLQLKELGETLSATKSELTPKAKFSFKSRKKKSTPTPAISSTPTPNKLPKEETDILGDATVLFKDQNDTILTLKDNERAQTSGKSVDILLSNLKGCVIVLENNDIQISAIHIKNVDRCIIYCGSIDGSILMYGLTHSLLVAGCHQLRMHDAHHVDMILHVTSRPIIEDSNNIRVGRLEGADTINYFDQIEDFNWLKKQASPNWKVMDLDRHAMIEKSLIMFKSDENLEHLLSKGLQILPA